MNNSYREFFGGKYAEYGTKKRKIGKFEQIKIIRSQIEYYFIRFLKTKIIPAFLKNQNGQLPFEKKYLKIANDCPFALISIESFMDGNEENMGKMG